VNPDSPDSPRVTAFHGVILCALAAILLDFCGWNSEILGRMTWKAAPTSRSCVYQVYQDDTCLGTVFLNGPATLRDIFGRLGIRDRGIASGEEEKLPCNCALRLTGSPPGRQVVKMAGHHLLAAGLPIDVNQADEKDLQALPGIGPTLAASIVSHREARGHFRDVRDLVNVPGIGKKRLAALRPFVEVKPVSRRPQASEYPDPTGSPSPSTRDPGTTDATQLSSLGEQSPQQQQSTAIVPE
jgi:competence ComEA-like helix-hairpin-helix protein